MEGHYAESQQSEERLEEEGSVSRSSRETGPAAASDYGAHSPRPARSQISTAVSFEPAHPANSAANGARSGEDSAASAAEPEGELSSLPQQPLQGAGQRVMSREAIAYPSGSLISTAMRPSAHAARQPHSPPAERATSVVSKTALRRSPEAVRAGTPASVYAQDRAPLRRALDASPHDSQAMEQARTVQPMHALGSSTVPDSNEGRAQRARQAIHHPAGSTAPAGGGHTEHPQRSEWQEASVQHYDGAASQPPDSHASRPAPEAQQNSQEGMQEGCLSAGGQDNSIEAVQQGDMYPEDLAAAASVARSMPGMPLDQQLAGLPGAYQAALAAMAQGTTLERSASASSERNAEPQHGQVDDGPLSMLAAALGQSLQQARPGSGQNAWASAGHGNTAQAVQQHACAAQHAPDGFSVPALPANSPFHSLASRYPAMLDAFLRSDHGLAAPAVAQTVRQELANALSAHSPAPLQQQHGAEAERVASTRAPNGNPGGFDGALPPPNGGSNEPSEMPHAAGSNENHASQQSLEDFMQQRLYTAGSLASPAEGELQDPSLAQRGPATGSPPMQDMNPAEVLQRPAGAPGPGQSRQLAGREAALQEAHSGAPPHRPPSAEHLHGADSGAMPALSIIRGLSGPFPASVLPGHANAFQRRAQAAAERAPAAHPQGSIAQGKHAAPQQRNSMAQSLALRFDGPGQQSQHDGPPRANRPAPADTAHAAASVHATVMSEEDAMSEGETHLSSRRAAASHSAQPRRAEAHAGAYADERQASHHTAGLAQEEQMREAVGTPVRQEMARPVDSTTAMAAAVAPTASCEQSVEMCPHGSPSAEAVAEEPANSSDSSPARALACKHHSASKNAGQVNSAPARLHQSGASGARPEGGGRSLPNGLSGHRERAARAGKEAYEARPQNSNGTTMGQVLAAGPQSAQPEGSLGSHAAVEQHVDKEASPAAGGHRHMAASAQGARPAASANTGMHLPKGCPPLPRGARPCSAGMRRRPSAPPFAAGLAAGGRGAGEGLRSGAHDTLRYTGSSPLQAPPLDEPHQAAAQDADTNPAALSGARPANAMVLAGAQSARGSPAPGHEMQSHPMPRADNQHDPEPQPALTVIMPSGCLPHVSEGRGESQPAAHSPEFQSQNMRGSGGPPNGTPQNDAARSDTNGAHVRGRIADHMHSNGHIAQTEGAPGVHDVLSGEDSAPDTGRAVTSLAPGSTPGRRRNSIGKRKRVNGGAVNQPRSSAHSGYLKRYSMSARNIAKAMTPVSAFGTMYE